MFCGKTYSCQGYEKLNFEEEAKKKKKEPCFPFIANRLIPERTPCET